MRWFDVPGLNFMHTLNAWDDREDEDEIVLIAVNFSPAENFMEKVAAMHFTVENIRINLDSGIVVRRPVSSRSLEFGVINQRFVGRKNRYAYMCMAAFGAPIPQICGLVKLDFEAADGVVACKTFGEGCFCGEPFFVPRTNDPHSAEDDGYIVVLTHNDNTQISKFCGDGCAVPDTGNRGVREASAKGSMASSSLPPIWLPLNESDYSRLCCRL